MSNVRKMKKKEIVCPEYMPKTNQFQPKNPKNLYRNRGRSPCGASILEIPKGEGKSDAPDVRSGSVVSGIDFDPS